jgi:VWFA-related protein
VLSDGGSFRDKTNLQTAIEFAQRADTIINSILYGGIDSWGKARRRIARVAQVINPTGAIYFARAKSNMRRMAQETGGAYFEISESKTIENAYTQIEDTLRSQYLIGFTPQSPGKPGKYHKLKLAVKTPGLSVQTRDGYYAR